MTTQGERFCQRLQVESPDFCTNSCLDLAAFLIDVTKQVDNGQLNIEQAFEPLTDLLISCPRAVESGGQSAIIADEARSKIKSVYLTRQGDAAPCVFRTFAASHAIMFARGEDPYFGDLDHDELDINIE